MRAIDFLAVAAAVGLWCGSASGDVTIRGWVTDSAGRPVGGALVFWLRPAPINSYPPSIDGQADGEGAFRLALIGAESEKDVQQDAVLVYAEGQGLGVTTVGALLKQADPVRVALPAKTESTFRVVDPDGHVLAGELVEPVLYNDGGVSKLPATFVQAVGRVTDDAGLVRLPALTRDRLKMVRVVSQTYGPQQLDLRYVPQMQEQVIQLRAAGRIEVTFDASAGRMAKCKMLAFTTGQQDPNLVVGVIGQGPLQGAWAEFFDDPRGFEIPALAAGALRFQLSGCTGREEVLPHWPEKTLLNPGETKKFTVPFEKTVTVRGRIVESKDGQPCPDVDVFVYTRDAGCSIRTRTDKEGRYRCNVLQGPVSSYATRSYAPGHPSFQQSLFQDGVAGPDGYEFPDSPFAQ